MWDDIQTGRIPNNNVFLRFFFPEFTLNFFVQSEAKKTHQHIFSASSFPLIFRLINSGAFWRVKFK